jgi:hypothetical protein
MDVSLCSLAKSIGRRGADFTVISDEARNYFTRVMTWNIGM